MSLIRLLLQRSTAGSFFTFGSALIIGKYFSVTEKLQTLGIPTDWISRLDFILICCGIFLVIAGVLLFFFDNSRNDPNKPVIVVELQGLSHIATTPLTDAIPPWVIGVRCPIFVDVRHLINGSSAQINEAINEVERVPARVKELIVGKNRQDIKLYCGSIASVPLQFMLGIGLTDQSKINWYEWARQKTTWVPADKGTYETKMLAPVYPKIDGDNIVLGMAVSYAINLADLKASFPGRTIMIWEVDKSAIGQVLSEQTITRITQQFREVICELQKRGIKHIHLALAANSVLSLRLGTAYSPRNMPFTTVYQYSKSVQGSQYPWGIGMPFGDNKNATFFHNK